jgi:hypothetical protein
MNVLPRLKLLNAMTTSTSLMVFLIKTFTTKKSIYMEPVQDLNLNPRYISRIEPEMPVTNSFHQINEYHNAESKPKHQLIENISGWSLKSFKLLHCHVC